MFLQSSVIDYIPSIVICHMHMPESSGESFTQFRDMFPINTFLGKTTKRNVFYHRTGLSEYESKLVWNSNRTCFAFTHSNQITSDKNWEEMSRGRREWVDCLRAESKMNLMWVAKQIRTVRRGEWWKSETKTPTFSCSLCSLGELQCSHLLF